MAVLRRCRVRRVATRLASAAESAGTPHLQAGEWERRECIGIPRRHERTEARGATRRSSQFVAALGQRCDDDGCMPVAGVGGGGPRMSDALKDEEAKREDLMLLRGFKDGVTPAITIAKAHAFWRAASKLLAHNSLLRFIGKVDDDSFVHVPRLLSAALLGMGCSRNIYFGAMAFTDYVPRRALKSVVFRGGSRRTTTVKPGRATAAGRQAPSRPFHLPSASWSCSPRQSCNISPRPTTLPTLRASPP